MGFETCVIANEAAPAAHHTKPQRLRSVCVMSSGLLEGYRALLAAEPRAPHERNSFWGSEKGAVGKKHRQMHTTKHIITDKNKLSEHYIQIL